MKLNTPLPQSLPKECAKAAKIFNSFVDRGNNGLDGVIPRHVLENAKGFAIFTIFKAGFLFSARAGSGIVIAKLDDGNWSCPSAIGTAGLGVGGQLGAEMTDFLVVLNSRSAVRSFMAAGSLTLGGNMSIAVGPLGRNGEATGAINSSGKLAAMYSYSKTRGLFGGLSIEGSVIVERQDANALAYQSDVSAKQLLSGGVYPPPEWASALVKTLENCTGLPGTRKWVSEDDGDVPRSNYLFGSMNSPGQETPPSSKTLKKKSVTNPFPPPSWGRKKTTGSYFDSAVAEDPNEDEDIYGPPEPKAYKPPPAVGNGNGSGGKLGPARFATHFESDFSLDDPKGRNVPTPSYTGASAYEKSTDTYTPGSPFNSLPPFDTSQLSSSHARSVSYSSPYDPSPEQSTNPFAKNTTGATHQRSFSLAQPPYLAPKPELSRPLQPYEGVARGIALFNFQAVESGDLSFSKGDIIIITKKSESDDDWWTGKLNGKEGIFPANFVEVA